MARQIKGGGPRARLTRELLLELKAISERGEQARIKEKRMEDDAPFATMTWQDWQEVQDQVDDCLEAFVEVVKQRKGLQVLKQSMAMIEVVGKMLLEAYALSIDEDLDLPPVPQGQP